MNASGALVIGLAVGAICYSATLLRERLKVDDALDVFAVHGVGGMFGAVDGRLRGRRHRWHRGSIEGNSSRSASRSSRCWPRSAFAALGTFVIIKVVEAVMGLRVEPSRGRAGAGPVSVHGEAAYGTGT